MRSLLLLFCLLLSACGQKGDLYLPDNQSGDNNETRAEEEEKDNDKKDS